ncbi:MAG TPA: site-specific integrase, partial [Planctomycetaceae bacterium]|nr:site-specific integrase [Planctomycetaceae bacterium]
GGKKEAERIAAELLTGTYESKGQKKTWAEFVAEYESLIASQKSRRSRPLMRQSLKVFGELCRLKHVQTINDHTIDTFVKLRKECSGKKPGTKISVATVNRDLRNIKAALRRAAKWGCIKTVPTIEFQREPHKIPRFVERAHFIAIFKACSVARMPKKTLDIGAPEWWQALLTLLYLTGWRIGDARALKREDVNIEKQTALTRAEDNKGKRDFNTPLHPKVLARLMPLMLVSKDGEPIFRWTNNDRMLYVQFRKIQKAAWDVFYSEAGRKAPKDEQGKIKPAWAFYGFHDLRRAFATENGGRLGGDLLQELMRHRSYSTTQRYLNLSERLEGSVDKLHVPDVLNEESERFGDSLETRPVLAEGSKKCEAVTS